MTNTRTSGLSALAMALLLVSGCATAVDPEPRHGSLPPAVAAYDSPEFAAYEPAGDETRSALPVAPTAIALFRGLVSKPALRPLSSLHRLFFFAADTTVDLVNPATLVLPRGGAVPPVSQGPGMDLEAWERRLDALTGSRASTGTMRFLIDGDQFFPALVGAVREARSSVDIRTYIFDTDDYATAFADLLKRRSGDVDVRVLVDGLGTAVASVVSPAYTPDDFEPPRRIAQYLERGSDVAVRVQPNPWFAGDHSKSFIIDRQVAFVGGMNIGREYRYEWHDMMVEVRGPVVQLIDREFDKAWSRAGFLGEFGYLARSLWPGKPNRSGNGDPIRLLFTRAGDSQIYRAQLAAIRAAKRYVFIENPYFADNEILLELINARRRGVDVRVILPHRGDSTVMDHGNVVAANAMFRNGIRVYLYPGFTHVKAAIFDGWACLGSANLDKMSLRVNEELNVATSHAETVLALREQLFEPDFEKSAEMTAPLPQDWSYRLAAFLADQL